MKGFLPDRVSRFEPNRGNHRGGILGVLAPTAALLALSALASACGSIDGPYEPEPPPPSTPAAPPREPPQLPPNYSAIHHIMSYGQSLSIGSQALPVLTTVQRHYSLKFAGGVRSQDGGTEASVIYANVVPLTEGHHEPGHRGETPVAGTLEHLNDLLFEENGIAAHANSVVYLGSAPGEGGRTIAELGRRSHPFRRLVDNIVHGADLAKSLGKTYSLTAVTWTQGEADYRDNTDSNEYSEALETLRLHIENAARPVSQNTTPLPLITYQTSSHPEYDREIPTIALAQLAASQRYPHIYLATPTYHFDYADRVHFTNRSSKWLGAYFGLAYKRIAIDKQGWRPLHPISAEAYGHAIEILFHVPVPPLAFDTGQITNPGDFGFQVVAPDGSGIPIRSIEIIDDQRVMLTLDRSVPETALVRYGFSGDKQAGRTSGPRGNLRDSQGDVLVFDRTGLNLRMDNWSVIFELPIGQTGY